MKGKNIKKLSKTIDFVHFFGTIYIGDAKWEDQRRK